MKKLKGILILVFLETTTLLYSLLTCCVYRAYSNHVNCVQYPDLMPFLRIKVYSSLRRPVKKHAV